MAAGLNLLGCSNTAGRCQDTLHTLWHLLYMPLAPTCGSGIEPAWLRQHHRRVPGYTPHIVELAMFASQLQVWFAVMVRACCVRDSSGSGARVRVVLRGCLLLRGCTTRCLMRCSGACLAVFRRCTFVDAARLHNTCALDVSNISAVSYSWEH
jgi:hypothetical protein